MIANQGIVHKLRPRLFPTFVVNPFSFQSNSALLQVILLLLYIFLTESIDRIYELKLVTIVLNYLDFTILTYLLCYSCSLY